MEDNIQTGETLKSCLEKKGNEVPSEVKADDEKKPLEGKQKKLKQKRISQQQIQRILKQTMKNLLKNLNHQAD